ncbi:hypothetical protein [Aureimonas mangrovi]|uniref:hypothetical protein n=1 Tax=Aureimonas mangrovi TaxID=2758041 RepID=UPI00163D497F|nr:hypothetical protein [Aureimonas mangrovi]
MNSRDNSSAQAAAASETYYRTAYRSLETQIHRIVSFASVAHYLSESLDEDRRRFPADPPNEAVVDHLFFLTSEAQAAAQDLDADWTKKFNAGPEFAQ